MVPGHADCPRMDERFFSVDFLFLNVRMAGQQKIYIQLFHDTLHGGIFRKQKLI